MKQINKSLSILNIVTSIIYTILYVFINFTQVCFQTYESFNLASSIILLIIIVINAIISIINFILIPDKDISNSSLYYYDNENITLKEREVPREKAFSINAPSNDIKENGNTLYYLVGIIKYY